MSGLALSLLAKSWPYVLAVVLAVVGGFGLRRSGANAEKAKQAVRDVNAVEERLEMEREATAAEGQAAGMTDEEARKEAMRWAKPR